MSFRAYKGRLFLLGFNDISIGTLSNWADRLLALTEDGDFIAAIRLATSYYVGSADKLTVGLPDDDDTRHDMVREKLLEMMAASLKYTFSRTPNSTSEDARSSQLKQLAVECFTACISMNELDFLFDDVYEWYEEGSSEDVFLETLEPHIVDDEIKAVPPAVLKDIVSHYTLQNRGSRIEELICRLDTRTIDIDQISTLCKQHYLYDALIYVWNQALGDYVSPLIDLLSLVKTVGYDADSPDTGASGLVDSAMKMFPYLAYTLTGRVYPNGLELPVSDASKAKAELYGFIFSGKAIPWPEVGGYVFHTQADASPEPSFPYLRMILKFDTSSFMSMLNEAFEDSFLNGSQDQQSDDYSAFGESDRQVSRSSLTRQYIVSILLEVMSPKEFGPQDAIYLDMFVARNLPKFPQFILLSGSSLHRVLEGLCKYPSDEVADDCQLSVEYLLSIYHPSDLQSLVPLFAQAGFHRVLKSVYKGEKQYAKLLEACLDDKDDRGAVFDCVGDCLRPSAGLTAKQTREVQAVIVSHSRDLADIDTARTARILKAYAPGLLRQVLDALDDGSQAQYIFLRTLLEPGLHQEQRDLQPSPDISDMGFTERYVRLMCMYDPSRVAGYVSFLKSGDLKLDKVLPAMESLGVVDAAVVLMAREGLVRDAMDRLVKHLGTLELALTGLISAASESPDVANTEEAAEDLLDAVQKYCKVGIWLCKGQTGATAASSRPAAHRKNTTWITEDDLAPHELLWLDLVDTVVRVAKQVSAAAAYALEHPSTEHAGIANTDRMTASLRSDVQQAFTALLASTSSSGARLKPPSNQTHSFLLILRAFLTRASQSSPSLSDLRAVIADIFSAYTFEDSLRSLANALLNKDLFAHVADARTLRDRGWRPRGMACGLCERRICGPGAGAGVWDAWERKELHDAEARALRRIERGGGEEARRLERGKGKASVVGLGKMGEGMRFIGRV
ncbi:hypothetical protein B0A49_06971 [Cryomyces minteri]|uniref:Uncharacterized protein n=1 Tax=Cryomyces minteri TaxID=331657 RepID=A0A4U0X3P2_9PEZI|nr:hypothetical protein B0A49_06971 [Cryomyces minteri]